MDLIVKYYRLSHDVVTKDASRDASSDYIMRQTIILYYYHFTTMNNNNLFHDVNMDLSISFR